MLWFMPQVVEKVVFLMPFKGTKRRGFLAATK
jgi:hypothetical protein